MADAHILPAIRGHASVTLNQGYIAPIVAPMCVRGVEGWGRVSGKRQRVLQPYLEVPVAGAEEAMGELGAFFRLFAARANNLCSDSCGIVSHHRIPSSWCDFR